LFTFFQTQQLWHTRSHTNTWLKGQECPVHNVSRAENRIYLLNGRFGAMWLLFEIEQAFYPRMLGSWDLCRPRSSVATFSALRTKPCSISRGCLKCSKRSPAVKLGVANYSRL
jgi:hypothetical protein